MLKPSDNIMPVSTYVCRELGRSILKPACFVEEDLSVLVVEVEVPETWLAPPTTLDAETTST